MKSKAEIEAALSKVEGLDASQYPGMTYEQGIDEALRWVLGEIPNDEFEYAES